MPADAPKPHDHTFHAIPVTRVVDETHDAKSFVLGVPPALAASFRYVAGQFVTLDIAVGGAMLRRCYSLASAPETDPAHKVTVKRVSSGRVSNFLADTVRAGSTLSVRAPEGRFVLKPHATPVVLFAGGSGITPCISLLKSALVSTKRPVRMLYANRDARSIIFRAELDALVARFAGRVEVVHHLDAERGFLADAALRAFVRDRASDFYLCGPGPFMEAAERALEAEGVPGANVHVERFLSAPDRVVDAAPTATAAAPAGAATPERVTVVIRGKKSEIAYKKGKSLLQATLDAGLDAPYSCEEGFCGCCVAKLTEGEVEAGEGDALSANDRKKGLILACQSRPKTARCTIEYIED